MPRRLHVELTNRCNSRCRACVRSVAPDPERDMDPAAVARIVEALPGLESVALQVNGEPLLYPQLPHVIGLLKQRGVFVELNTNGLALRGRRVAWLLDHGLDELNVSLDAATPETYRRLRGVDTFRRLVTNLEDFVFRRGEPPATPRVRIWVMVTRHNVYELPALVDLAARVGVDGVYLQRLVTFGEGLACESDSLHGRLTADQRAMLAQASERARRHGLDLRASGGHDPEQMLAPEDDPEPYRTCRRPWESAVVLADGDVVPCCICTFVAPRETIRMGNVLRSGWPAVWDGAPYRNHRAGLLAGNAPEFCRGCGVRWSL